MLQGTRDSLLRFGEFTLDWAKQELRQNGQVIELQEQPLRVLWLLAGRAGEVVTRAEIQEVLWGDKTYVDFDKGIYYCIKEVRRALGDHPEESRYIRTVPKHGYCFTAKVEAEPTVRPPPDLFPVPRGVERRRSSVKWWVPLALLGFLFTVGTTRWFGFSTPDEAPPRTVPLTNWPGEEMYPALSPDGEQVAFMSDGGDAGLRGLYVKMVDFGEPRLLISGSHDGSSPAWSPDGSQIAFFRYARAASGGFANGLFIVSALGGTPRQLGFFRTGMGGLSWSPDGSDLALSHKDAPETPSAIYLLSLKGDGMHKRTQPPPDCVVGDYYPRFSPDGRTLAFVRAAGVYETDIYLVSANGGEPRRLTFGNRQTWGLDWSSNGKSIVFSSNRAPGPGPYSLWRVDISGGEPERLGAGEEGKWPSLSRTGRLAYMKHHFTLDLRRVGGPTSDEKNRKPHAFISSTSWDSRPEYSPDGRKILFASGRYGFSEIWVADSGGTNLRQLTFLQDPLTTHGTWSPDGEWVAFTSPKEGSFDIFVVNATGAVPSRITTEAYREVYPSWSRDGRWIYYQSNRSGRRELWKSPAEGGEPIQVTRNGGARGVESLDGRYVYFTKRDWGDGPPGLWRIPVGDGTEEQVLDRVSFLDWAICDQGIVFLDRRGDSPTEVKLYDLDTGTVSPIVALGDMPHVQGISVPPDGKWMVYVASESESDIMLVENFR